MISSLLKNYLLWSSYLGASLQQNEFFFRSFKYIVNWSWVIWALCCFVRKYILVFIVNFGVYLRFWFFVKEIGTKKLIILSAKCFYILYYNYFIELGKKQKLERKKTDQIPSLFVLNYFFVFYLFFSRFFFIIRMK